MFGIGVASSQASDAQLLLQYGIPPPDASANPFNEALWQSFSLFLSVLYREAPCEAILVLPSKLLADAELVFHLPREAGS